MANKKMRILLVGKYPSRLQMSEQTLNRLGYYRIASTTSATEAVSLARCLLTPFDVLIVDHDIIQPSGLDLIERCHQQGLAAHFILSGNPPQALQIRAKERTAPPPIISFVDRYEPIKKCSDPMKPDTHLGENARQIEVADDQATSFLFR
ncbi:MAG: hypothetical protein HY309_02205 [Pseudomonas fluorescens]|nr:hypothetical protein [Pseudomonas fluorescens]